MRASGQQAVERILGPNPVGVVSVGGAQFEQLGGGGCLDGQRRRDRVREQILILLVELLLLLLLLLVRALE